MPTSLTFERFDTCPTNIHIISISLLVYIVKCITKIIMLKGIDKHYAL